VHPVNSRKEWSAFAPAQYLRYALRARNHFRSNRLLETCRLSKAASLLDKQKKAAGKKRFSTKRFT
jgi:hypothetical protein